MKSPFRCRDRSPLAFLIATSSCMTNVHGLAPHFTHQRPTLRQQLSYRGPTRFMPAPVACEAKQPPQQEPATASSSSATAADLIADPTSGISCKADPGTLIVGVLLLLFTVNQWSRQLLLYTVNFAEPYSEKAALLFINIDVGFDQAQYGIVASIGFAALFSLASLFAGRVVDRTSPRELLASTTVLWSLASVWQGCATSFNDILGSRMLCGFSQAFTNPAAYTLLARLYPEERLATVNGVYSSGLYFGGALASLSILLDQYFGWRQLSIFIGLLGLAVALLTQLTLPGAQPAAGEEDASSSDGSYEEDAVAVRRLLISSDPKSAASEEQSAESQEEPLLTSLKLLLERPTVQWLLTASALRFMAGFCIAVWIVPFYRGQFPADVGAEFSILKACVNGIAGATSAAAGGYLCDQLSSVYPKARQWVPAAGSLLAVPCWIGTIEASTIEFSLGFLFLEYLFAECWFGPTIAALQSAAPTGSRGLAQGTFSTLTLVGNVAPALVGVLLRSSTLELPTVLLYTVPVLYGCSALAFVGAGESISSEKRTAEAKRQIEADATPPLSASPDDL